jgi:hypothetical protein
MYASYPSFAANSNIATVPMVRPPFPPFIRSALDSAVRPWSDGMDARTPTPVTAWFEEGALLLTIDCSAQCSVAVAHARGLIRIVSQIGKIAASMGCLFIQRDKTDTATKESSASVGAIRMPPAPGLMGARIGEKCRIQRIRFIWHARFQCGPFGPSVGVRGVSGY